MAGHLEVNKIVQYDLYKKLWAFLDKQSINGMKPFDRYKNEDVTFQRLTDRNEEEDTHVISVYPHTFKFEGEEDCEFAIAEIHLSADLTVNKVYMVM